MRPGDGAAQTGGFASDGQRSVAVSEMGGFALVAAASLLRYVACVVAEGHPLDEERYFDGIFALVAQADPYERYGVLYPPTFYAFGSGLLAQFGERGAAFALRVATALAIAGVAWLAARATERPFAERAGLAAIAVLVFPPFAHAMELGNISPLVIALAMAALALWPAMPVVGGIALGFSLALKPLGAALAPILALRGRATLPARHRFPPGAVLAIVSLAVVAAYALLAGPRLLPRFLALSNRPFLGPYQLSFVSAFAEIGSPLPVGVPLAAMIFAAWRLRGRKIDLALFRAVAPALALAGAPIVWLHTQALALPIVLRALRGPRAFTGGARRRFELPLRLALVAAVGGAGGIGAIRVEAWPALVRVTVALVPLGSVLMLIARCLADDASSPPLAEEEGPPRTAGDERRD